MPSLIRSGLSLLDTWSTDNGNHRFGDKLLGIRVGHILQHTIIVNPCNARRGVVYVVTSDRARYRPPALRHSPASQTNAYRYEQRTGKSDQEAICAVWVAHGPRSAPFSVPRPLPYDCHAPFITIVIGSLSASGGRLTLALLKAIHCTKSR